MKKPVSGHQRTEIAGLLAVVVGLETIADGGGGEADRPS